MIKTIKQKSLFILFVLAICISVLLPVNMAMAQSTDNKLATTQAKSDETDKKYVTWQDVARDMHVEFEKAIQNIQAGNNKAAYDDMNKAYFGYYETQGFEKNVMFAISKKRVSHIEAQFRSIKHILLGNKAGGSKQDLINDIKSLDVKVYRDALVLDGVVGKDAPDEVGKVIFENKHIEKSNPLLVKTNSFLVSFGLLLREGLEAILVCVAIVAYLVKSGNKRLVKHVYWGMFAGVVGSGILAVLIHYLLGGAGQELFEGYTMFLAVIVLFWVSNWMLHKSEEESWKKYIRSKVDISVDKRSQWGLVGAAFLAVIREGAELILFYRGALAGGKEDTTYSILGFLAALLLLVIIYVVFRYTTVKLPLKLFFTGTSILLYILCISFMGKGVVELTEAGVISGGTTIPALQGLNIPELGLYDRAETLIPQIMLLITSAWILIAHKVRSKREMREIKEENSVKEKTN